jgi:hypothetical protein
LNLERKKRKEKGKKNKGTTCGPRTPFSAHSHFPPPQGPVISPTRGPSGKCEWPLLAGGPILLAALPSAQRISSSNTSVPLPRGPSRDLNYMAASGPPSPHLPVIASREKRRVGRILLPRGLLRRTLANHLGAWDISSGSPHL